MFSNLKNIFKVEDLRKKVFFTLAMIAVYRFGTALRVPGVDAGAVAVMPLPCAALRPDGPDARSCPR